MQSLVSGEWLAAHVADVRVVDVRWYRDGRSGRAAYEAGHIPGAVWIDVDHELSEPATATDGRHPLATPQRFAATLGRLGIAAGTPVVAYDDAGGAIAARLWWMLHVLDEPVAVLDGGITAWPGELSADEPSHPSVPRAAVAWPKERFVTADEVAAFAGTVYDARPAERFVNGSPPLDPRPGHIPGALSAPYEDNLDGNGRLLAPADLRARYQGPAIAYCGSGVTACHTLLAMHLAGIDDTALYTGSWSQWANDPSRPIETGTA
jgi:thiosulfate/3-mercaptopyruvate sulfurtransferase